VPLIDAKQRRRRTWTTGELRPPLMAAVRRLGMVRRFPVPDDLRACVLGVGHLGTVMNLRRPRTFNERLLWLLIHTHDERRARLADKLAVKDYVAQRAPWVRTAEVFTTASHASGLELDALPQVSVFKANNDSGGLKVLERPFDAQEVRDLASTWLARDPLRNKPPWERHYREIEPRVFVEAYLGTDPRSRVNDYRFFTFSGRVAVITAQVRQASGRRVRLVLDRDWNYLPVGRKEVPGGRVALPDPGLVPERPKAFSDMLRAAETLAADFAFVRVDMYLVGDDVYFGEMTFAPNAGFTYWPRDLGLALGALLRLPGGR